MSDYIPYKDGDLLKWLGNFSAKIAQYAAALGYSADDVKNLQDTCKNISDGISAGIQAQATAKKANQAKLSITHTGTGVIRTYSQRGKKAEGYTDEIGVDLGIVGTDDPVNPETYKTTLSAVVFPGRISVKFIKNGVEGVNIYSKLKGEDNWAKLAFDSYSPYEDNRPLHVAGTPEVRQYMAIGVMHDHEIGQMSDIIEVTFGG